MIQHDIAYEIQGVIIWFCVMIILVIAYGGIIGYFNKKR